MGPGTVRNLNVAGVPARVISGDMTALKVDALVIPAFPKAAARGGISAAIAQKGAGPALKAYEAMADSGKVRNHGDVAMTPSGNAQWPNLIHVASLAAGPGREAEVISQSVQRALETAARSGLKSVAIPIMGVSVFDSLGTDAALRAMQLGVARAAASSGKTLPSITFVGLDEAQANAMAKGLSAPLGAPPRSAPIAPLQLGPRPTPRPSSLLSEAQRNEEHAYLGTVGRVSGKQVTTELWFGANGSTLYLTNSTSANWVKNMLAHPDVTVTVGGKTYQARARQVTDARELAQANSVVRHKYFDTMGANLEHWQAGAHVYALELQR